MRCPKSFECLNVSFYHARSFGVQGSPCTLYGHGLAFLLKTGLRLLRVMMKSSGMGLVASHP